jgi:3-hydroxypropanoate dehydrogenase
MTTSNPLHQTARLDEAGLDLIFRNARTHNGWLDQPVPEALLREAVEIAKTGPTSANISPMRIVYVRSPEAREKLKDALAPGNVEKTMTAPVTAIVGYDKDAFELLPKLFPHADARAWFAGNEAFATDTAYRNGTLQVAYFILALRSLGLDTGPMTGFDADKIDAAFFAGTKVRSNVLVNIGHGDASKLFPRSPRLSFNEIARFA